MTPCMILQEGLKDSMKQNPPQMIKKSEGRHKTKTDGQMDQPTRQGVESRVRN